MFWAREESFVRMGVFIILIGLGAPGCDGTANAGGERDGASEETVTAEMVVANLLKNVENAKGLIELIVPAIPLDEECSCHSALAAAIVTDMKKTPPAIKHRLKPIAGRYLTY